MTQVGIAPPVVLDGSRLELFAALLEASETEGYDFVRRVVDQWASGANRFERPGEALLGSFAGEQLIGVCGLMRDHYLDDPRVARLRNVYVLPSLRGQGVGAALTRESIRRARGTFDLLRLRAASDGAARLYERLGFRPTPEREDATHVLDLRRPGETNR